MADHGHGRHHGRYHGHDHGHGPDDHPDAHVSSMGLDPTAPHRPGVHRLGRRRFLTELGRNTVAIAILGGVVTACGGDDDAGEAPADPSGAPSGEPPSPDTVPTTEAERLRWEQVRLGFVSAYVLVRGSEAAVVDTGSSGSADQIGESLAVLGAGFDAVRHIVLTHHHPDHVGSLPAVMERAATASTYAGEADIATIAADGVRAVGDGDDVFGLQVIETPGHTPGSISLFDPGIGLLVAGDALTGNGDGTAVLGPNEDFTADMATARASVATLAALDVRTAVFGHGQPVEDDAGDLLRALA